MPPTTLLIGLDGATFTILDPMMQTGVMPFLREFVASGVRAELRTIIPALTPPAWTSLMTGRSPGQHGILDFFRRETPQSLTFRFAFSNDVVADTIWSMANRQGRQVTVLNFPLMFPAPPLDGYLVPGWLPWKQLRLGCRPTTLFDRLKALPGFSARELVMDMGMEAKALEGCAEDEWEDWIQLHMRREQQWLFVLRTLMNEDPSELTAVLFDGVDKLQHLFWRLLDPAVQPDLLSPLDQRTRASCVEYFRQLDRILAEIVELAGPEATVIMTSDHGFGPQIGTFFVNAWLAQQGYLVWADPEAVAVSTPGELGIDRLSRHVYNIDWQHTKAFVPSPSANGVYIVRANEDTPGGVLDSEYEAFRDQLKHELGQVIDPASGQAVVAEIWTSEEIFCGPFQELAPDLTLVMADGGLVSILDSDLPYKLRPEPRGTHRPEGVFIARGPGMRKGAVLGPLSILDVAPTLLYTLQLPIPTNLEGRLVQEAFEATSLKALPAQSTDSDSQAPALSVSQAATPILDAESEAELMRRLRALGYVA